MKVGEEVRPSPGERIVCVQSGRDGGPFIFEMELGPRVKGPPMHAHDEGDEVVEVLEGEIVFRVGGEDRTLRAGEALTLTPADAHTFWNPSPTAPVRCRVVHGARFERAISQPDFSRMAMYLTWVDAGASRMASPAVRGVLWLVALFGRLRGLQPVR